MQTGTHLSHRMTTVFCTPAPSSAESPGVCHLLMELNSSEFSVGKKRKVGSVPRANQAMHMQAPIRVPSGPPDMALRCGSPSTDRRNTTPGPASWRKASPSGHTVSSRTAHPSHLSENKPEGQQFSEVQNLGSHHMHSFWTKTHKGSNTHIYTIFLGQVALSSG